MIHAIPPAATGKLLVGLPASSSGMAVRFFADFDAAGEQSQLAVDLATEQYRAGLVDFLSVLDAQRELYAD